MELASPMVTPDSMCGHLLDTPVMTIQTLIFSVPMQSANAKCESVKMKALILMKYQ